MTSYEVRGCRSLLNSKTAPFNCIGYVVPSAEESSTSDYDLSPTQHRTFRILTIGMWFKKGQLWPLDAITRGQICVKAQIGLLRPLFH
jgi:hypothetical protein